MVDHRNQIAVALDKYRIPQSTLAEFADLSQPSLSLYLAGKKGLSINSQLALLKGLDWLCSLARETKTPIDFSNVAALWPLWCSHLSAEAEAELTQLAAEQR